MNPNIIAIDGPAYVGKSVIAKALSEITGHLYINTGHMYRAIARLALADKIEATNERALIQLTRATQIHFQYEQGNCRTLVNGLDWTNDLDPHEIVRFASKIAVIGEIRTSLTEKQRAYAKDKVIIMEGRDIGSIVFPDAQWKFFVTASLEIRAQRMLKMMPAEEKKNFRDLAPLIKKVQDLDDADRNRKIAPLKMAKDAMMYDNSDSPSGMQDALILQYYMTHASELIQNSGILAQKQ